MAAKVQAAEAAEVAEAVEAGLFHPEGLRVVDRLLPHGEVVVHAHQVGARRHARWDVDQRVMIL